MARIITTVLNAAESYDLVTLAQVRTELKLTETDTARDAFLSAAISQESRGIANYCHRVFVLEDVRDEFILTPFEVFSDLAPLQLSRFPVTEITSLSQASGPGVSPDDYRLIADGGQVYRLSGGVFSTWDASETTVEYTAGFEEVPADVQQAALRMITMRFKGWGRDPMLMQQDGQQTGSFRWWVGPQQGQNGAYAPEVAGLLDPYVIPVLA